MKSKKLKLHYELWEIFTILINLVPRLREKTFKQTSLHLDFGESSCLMFPARNTDFPHLRLPVPQCQIGREQ